MRIEKFLAEASSWSTAATYKMPAEIGTLLRRQLDLDKNLATSVLAFGNSYAVKDVAWGWYCLARSHEGDLATLRSVASSYFRNQSLSYLDCYALSETSVFLSGAADAVNDCSEWNEFADILYSVVHHMIRTYYWIDASFPWAKLSPVHASLVKGRLVTGADIK
jgi:hypothetical protein